MTKQHRSKLLQDIYLQYFVTKPSWLLFGTDTVQPFLRPTAFAILVKYPGDVGGNSYRGTR